MKLSFGSKPPVFLRDRMFYVSIQAIIFVKVILFFFIFGHGISYFGQPLAVSLPFAGVPVFGNLVHVWDYMFHQIMHALIAVWVFLFAKHMEKVRIHEVAGLFLIATALHNVGYWLTSSHPSWSFSVHDFIVDFVALWVFFGVFWFFFHIFPKAKKWDVPFFREK